ncbi:MAG: tetratricopeptide repeat protein [Gemmatimonadetes bacterium]|nr:tetratricopeptide repeat protein [Gemmatimonadota bacterium]
MCALSLPAQATTAADAAFAARKWSEAAAAYQAVTRESPGNGPAWTNLGESLLQLGRHDEARAAFEKAESIRYRPFINIINQARVEAARNNDDRVYPLLQRVADGGAGGALRGYIVGSTEFERLLPTPRWKSFVATLKPCTSAPYRQFDFWVGDWDVFGPKGQQAGHNLVTLEQDGCLLVEHWSGNGGSTGTSFNYFDVRDRKWHQLYIDNSGNAGAFPAMAGAFTDGKMVLLTDDVNNALSRWTWYVMSPGHVKQMAEQSSDHGATWQVTWDAVYVKKGTKP